MLTSYGELATITLALDAGADGYVLKNSMPEEVLEGIRIVAEGGRFLCDRICRSFDTVRSYRKALYIKLNAHSTRELISKAVEAGLA